MMYWDKIRNKQVMCYLALTLAVLSSVSCRTCKCPAYSEDHTIINKDVKSEPEALANINYEQTLTDSPEAKLLAP
ncbi:hypothetical protein [Maribellus mangrovi]|uniref:hypothetical protein n=1 Tax=Maribellus mangrovi TaxID=3133146 RepID=UPI0030EE8415